MPPTVSRRTVDIHQRRRAAYLAIASDEPQRCRVIDASKPVDAIAKEIAAIVDDMLAALLSEPRRGELVN